MKKVYAAFFVSCLVNFSEKNQLVNILRFKYKLLQLLTYAVVMKKLFREYVNK